MDGDDGSWNFYREAPSFSLPKTYLLSAAQNQGVCVELLESFYETLAEVDMK